MRRLDESEVVLAEVEVEVEVLQALESGMDRSVGSI